MPLELLPATAEHVPTLARICHEAFSALHDRHAVARDVPDVATGELIVGHCVGRDDYAGVVATLDGRIVGSNFLLHADEVAGVGPITVDPAVQARGVGRALMQWAIDESRRRGIAQTRLFQEALNTASLSLYTSLGFAWRDAAALMQPRPADADDPAIRALTADDLPAIDSLSRHAYGHSRVNDATQLLAAGIPGFLREGPRGVPVAYSIASLFGHTCAESLDDLLALPAYAARHLPPPLAVFICPLSLPDAHRRALAAGHRTVKVLSAMSFGDYTPPPGPCFPSIQC